MIICENSEIILCDTNDTRSGRIYPLSEMQKMVDNVNQSSEPILGEFAGSDDTNINLEKVTHAVTNLRIEGTRVIGDIKILDTPNGVILQKMIREGHSVKCNPRGIGIVNDDWTISDYGDVLAARRASDSCFGKRTSDPRIGDRPHPNYAGRREAAEISDAQRPTQRKP